LKKIATKIRNREEVFKTVQTNIDNIQWEPENCGNGSRH